MNMTGRGFFVKIQLDLRAVTCPGVWLCPNGKISLKINTLNSNRVSHRITPVFPLLFHEKFTFEKMFFHVISLTELQHSLEQEFFFAELVQWVTPSGREVILATFETNLVDLLYPTSCLKDQLACVDIDLLMESTKYFPGIIAPKIEVSTKTIIEGIIDINNIKTSGIHIINPKTINSKNVSWISKKRPVKGIIRQKRVCHSQGIIKDQNYQLSQQKSNNKLNSYTYPIKRIQCSNDQYCCAGKRFICDCEPCYSEKKSKPLASYNDLHTYDKCPVCLKYKYYFSNQNDPTNTAQSYNIYCKKDLLKDHHFSKCIYQFSNDQNDNIIQSPNNVHTAQEEPTVSMLGSKVKTVDNVNETYHKCEQNQLKDFYKNMEKFYKRMYEQARMHAEEIDP
ncbi:spermatogenesis-associated protein 6 isoform X2 [Vespula pensylvanica]|uniref:Spermatogenesis-associated protein 6 N-terminal domain-containing protein n=1 Tax=Vespula pensylvanica TaxID=30213 RepID=A0A834U8B3_VESPE|nr:spermatogenesis-associated protein 6 isoform X2 [Vespula pensylvanica]KAF7421439.1 hypothetical protein H0235_009275 [Vespula pensylvanica]